MRERNVMRRILPFISAVVLFSGCGGAAKPIQQAMDGIRMAKEGNKTGMESLRIAKEMNDKLAYEQKIHEISKEMLLLTDKEIPKRDEAASGAEFAVVMVRKVNKIADDSFRKALATEKLSREQQEMAKEQLKLTRRIFQIAKTTDKLSREGKKLLKKSLVMAQQGTGMK